LLPDRPTLKALTQQTESEVSEVLQGADETDFVISFGAVGDDNLYDSVKQQLLVKYGTLCQHVTYENTIDRIKEYESQGNSLGIKAVLTNLAMQICAKLGGAPWAFNETIFGESCPIIGIDVNHLDRDSDIVSAACAVFDEY